MLSSPYFLFTFALLISLCLTHLFNLIITVRESAPKKLWFWPNAVRASRFHWCSMGRNIVSGRIILPSGIRKAHGGVKFGGKPWTDALIDLVLREEYLRHQKQQKSRGYVQKRPCAFSIMDSGTSLMGEKSSRYSGSMGRKRHRGQLIQFLFTFLFLYNWTIGWVAKM